VATGIAIAAKTTTWIVGLLVKLAMFGHGLLLGTVVVGTAGGAYYMAHRTEAPLEEQVAERRQVIVQEAERAFLEYQWYCRQGNVAAIVDCYDLEVWARLRGSDKEQIRRQLARNTGGFPALVAAATVDSVVIEQESNDASIQMVTGMEGIKIALEGPLVRVTAGDWVGHFHRTQRGWRLLFQEVTGQTAARTRMRDPLMARIEH
jgi:hypothetical protein